MLTMDEDRHHGLARGAFSFVTKPTTPEGLDAALLRLKEYATPRRKRLLVVEDNPAEQLSIKELLGYDDIDVTTVSTGGGSAGCRGVANLSIVPSSISVFRICRASRYWSVSATIQH